MAGTIPLTSRKEDSAMLSCGALVWLAFRIRGRRLAATIVSDSLRTPCFIIAQAERAISLLIQFCRSSDLAGIRVAVVAVTLLPAVESISAADADTGSELSWDAAVAAIAESERRIEAVRFHCEVWQGLYVRTETSWERRAGTTHLDREPGVTGVLSAHSDVLFSHTMEKCNASINLLTKTTMDAEKPEDRDHYMNHRDNFSNDGQVFRRQNRATMSHTRPEVHAAIMDEGWGESEMKPAGLICAVADEAVHHENKGFMKMNGAQLGIGHVTPYVLLPMFEQSQKLSRLLQFKKESGDYVAARTTPDGSWEFFYYAYKSYKTPYGFRILYDPVRGRVIRCEFGGCRTCEVESWDDWRASEVTDYVYENDDAVIPSVVFQINMHSVPLEKDGEVLREGLEWTYSSQQLNPPVSDADFRLTFDEGVEVMDYIEKRIYLVGAGLEKDQQSIERFMLYHGLEGAVPATGPPAPSKSRRWNWILIAGNVLVLGVIITVLSRRKAGNRLWLLAVAVSASDAFALAPACSDRPVNDYAGARFPADPSGHRDELAGTPDGE